MRAFILSLPVGLLSFCVVVLQANTIHVPSQQPTIQAGIDTAVDGDTVLVADGTYTGDGNRDIDFHGKAIVVMSENGAENCVIDCEGSEVSWHRGFYFHSGEDSSSTVHGFTIQNGYVDSYYLYGFGGAILCDSLSSPTITSNTITGNEAGYGGGIYCNYSSPTIIDNTITGNTAFGGGGIYCWESSPTITDNIITENEATLYAGGGICCYECASIIEDNIIMHNRADTYGGGIAGHGNTKIFNNIIASNTAHDGGGIVCYGPNIIIGNTISGNTAGSNGGGMYCGWNSSPTITNSILWGDSPDEIYVESGNPVFTYSDVEGGWPGEGNIDIDPLFKNPSTSDYHLMAITCGDSADSPCIDAGHPDSVDVILDCQHGLGTERCDMGAYGGRGGPPVSIKEPSNPKVIPLPKTFSLFQNYPNPFNPTTTISFDIPGTSGIKQRVQLIVYNIRGKQVTRLIDSELELGSHRVIWNGKDEQGHQVSSGIYLYTLRSGDKSYTKKMILLK